MNKAPKKINNAKDMAQAKTLGFSGSIKTHKFRFQIRILHNGDFTVENIEKIH